MYVKFQLSSSNSFRDMMGSQICTSGGCWFLSPCEMQRANWEIWHDRLFKAATAPTGGMTLARCTQRGPLERRIYKKFSTFTLLGYPLRQWFSEIRGPSYPMFGTVIGLSSVLAKFVFWFPIKCHSSKIRRPEDDLGRNLGQNLRYFPPCKTGAAWVECLWIFYEHSRGPHCWCSIGGHLLGVGHWNGGHIRNFPLLSFWVPIAPTVLRVGRSIATDPEYGTMVDLSSVLGKFCFW